MTDSKKRETLHLPQMTLKNFKLAEPVPNLDAWFHDFGRALEEFRRMYERPK